MKLDDFLEELILEQNNWTHERFMQEKDIKRQLKNKFTALIGRLNLLFEDLPDTYTAVPISVEKADMFQLYEYRLPTGELKKYEKERETIEKIFLCIVLLYDKIDHAENREFLKKFYFKAKKLFFKIGLRPYKTDYWRRKAIIKCLELLDTDKIDIGEEEAGVRKLRLEICLYSGQERKRSAFLENL